MNKLSAFYPVKEIEENNGNEIYENEKSTRYKYIVNMYPYPSGNLHAGHARAFTIGDVVTRYFRLNDYKVLQPMGFDSFGLPARVAAQEHGICPIEWTEDNIKVIRKDLESCKFSFNWECTLSSHHYSYYKHQQSFIIRLWEANLLEFRESIVNWDPKLKTVLANEQIDENGLCWRSGVKAEKKIMKQWFLKSSKYAETLLNYTDKLNWPDKVKKMQKNWIGLSSGVEIIFEREKIKLPVFTTCPETIFGVTFLALSPDSDLAYRLYKKQTIFHNNSQSILEPIDYLSHPYTGESIPIYFADYVLADYGTGAVMGVPSLDERDREFAVKNNISSKSILRDNKLINSNYLDGMTIEEAKNFMFKKLGIKKNYRLRDWCISRQGGWGTPMPMIHCESCGIVADRSLPKLPDDLDRSITGNPLECESWMKTPCPRCKGEAVRDVNVMDTFVESSWYFYRYPAILNHSNGKSMKLVKMDMYLGGVEHATMHLIYARVMYRMLCDIGVFGRDPDYFVDKLFCFGMVLGPTYKGLVSGNYYSPSDLIKKDNKWYANREEVVVGKPVKMSKSLNNGYKIADLIKSYGSDAIRLLVISDSPADSDLIWNANSMSSFSKFLNKIYHFTQYLINTTNDFSIVDDKDLIIELDKLFLGMSKAIINPTPKLNVYSSNLRKIFNVLKAEPRRLTHATTIEYFIRFLVSFSCVCPSISEACIKEFGQNIKNHKWYHPAIEEKACIDLIIQINGAVKKIEKQFIGDELDALNRAREIMKISQKTKTRTISKRNIFIVNFDLE